MMVFREILVSDFVTSGSLHVSIMLGALVCKSDIL